LLSGLPTPAAAATETSLLRYVFVVDTSATANGHKQAIINAITTRITAEFEGQVRAGEQFAIWTYDTTLATNRYLPITWNPKKKAAICKSLATALQDQGFYGEGRLDRVMRNIAQATRGCEFVAVAFVNDAVGGIGGTPFDQKINQAYAQAAQGGSRPSLFVTTLLVRNGRVIGWSVETVGFSPAFAATDKTVTKSPADSPRPIWTRESGAGSRPPTGPQRPVITETKPAPPTVSVVVEGGSESQPMRGELPISSEADLRVTIPEAKASVVKAEPPVLVPERTKTNELPVVKATLATQAVPVAQAAAPATLVAPAIPTDTPPQSKTPPASQAPPVTPAPSMALAATPPVKQPEAPALVEKAPSPVPSATLVPPQPGPAQMTAIRLQEPMPVAPGPLPSPAPPEPSAVSKPLEKPEAVREVVKQARSVEPPALTPQPPNRAKVAASSAHVASAAPSVQTGSLFLVVGLGLFALALGGLWIALHRRGGVEAPSLISKSFDEIRTERKKTT
jgi:hypothetical protein